MFKEFSIFTLSNGIRVIHQNYTHSNVCHLGIIVNAGSGDEAEDEHGLAHFIEHVIFKGTKNNNAFDILSRIDSVGGEINAYTTKEDTCVFAAFLKEHYDISVDLLADIFFNSTFPKKEIEKEKVVIVDEIQSYMDSPSDMISEDFERLLFPNHSIGRDILGTKESIQKFTQKDIRNFMQKHYTLNNFVVSSVGNISQKELTLKLEKAFAGYSVATKNIEKKKVIPAFGFHKTHKKKTSQSHYVLGNSAYSLKDKKKTAMTLLTNVLGGPAMNSILNLEIREKHGLTYNIEANYSPFIDAGMFSIYLGTDKTQLDKTVSLVKKELKKLRDKKLSTQQLSAAKQQIIGQITMANENRSSVMLSHGKSLVTYNKVDLLSEIYTKINAITSTQIQDIANEVFDERKMSELVYLNR